MSAFRDSLPSRQMRGWVIYEDEACHRCGGWADRVVGGELLCHVCGERAQWSAALARSGPGGSP